MNELIPNETKYNHLSKFLRSGGKLIIGEDHVLEAMDHQAKNYFEDEA